MKLNKSMNKIAKAVIFGCAVTLVTLSCTQESQNKIGRAVLNWTGTDGTLEIYSGGKLVRRFVKIDKISTASATGKSGDRPYRFGYGVLDQNLNGVADSGETRYYFEFSDYSTEYVFFGD